MLRPRTRRLLLVLFFGAFLASAVAMVLYGLRQNVTFFYTPHELAQLPEKPAKAFRLGGMVQKGSYKPIEGGGVIFTVGDLTDSKVTVTYKGLVPDLFREGQGVITEGTLKEDGTFEASQVLAKHDEKYMPPQLEKSLKEQGKR